MIKKCDDFLNDFKNDLTNLNDIKKIFENLMVNNIVI